jgi:hypothetical protein
MDEARTYKPTSLGSVPNMMLAFDDPCAKWRRRFLDFQVDISEFDFRALCERFEDAIATEDHDAIHSLLSDIAKCASHFGEAGFAAYLREIGFFRHVRGILDMPEPDDSDQSTLATVLWVLDEAAHRHSRLAEQMIRYGAPVFMSRSWEFYNPENQAAVFGVFSQIFRRREPIGQLGIVKLALSLAKKEIAKPDACFEAGILLAEISTLKELMFPRSQLVHRFFQ